MAEFNKKNQYKFWHSPLMLCALFLVLVLFSVNIVRLVVIERDTAKKKAIELDKIENLRSRESDLSSSIDKLKTDEGIEETIRDKYQVHFWASLKGCSAGSRIRLFNGLIEKRN